MSHPIVVGYDGTPAGTNALRWALENAPRESPVVAVAIQGTEPIPLPGGDPLARVATRMAHDERDFWLAWDRDQEALGDAVELVVEHGRPSDLLLRVAREREARLLVMGRHHRQLAMLRPSVLRDVLDDADLPVVVVPW
jgi:nucleotide-binding universal stress UspA family protein